MGLTLLACSGLFCSTVRILSLYIGVAELALLYPQTPDPFSPSSHAIPLIYGLIYFLFLRAQDRRSFHSNTSRRFFKARQLRIVQIIK
jgi:hypothetical protein